MELHSLGYLILIVLSAWCLITTHRYVYPHHFNHDKRLSIKKLFPILFKNFHGHKRLTSAPKMKGGSNLKVHRYSENMIFLKDSIGRNSLKFRGCRILHNFPVGT